MNLQALVAVFLHFQLHKTKSVQCSNWEAPRYTERQLNYAATDAWVGYLLHERIVQLLPKKNQHRKRHDMFSALAQEATSPSGGGTGTGAGAGAGSAPGKAEAAWRPAKARQERNSLMILNEECQKHGWPLPKFSELQSDGPGFCYEVSVEGKRAVRGEVMPRKKEAKRQAAAAFLARRREDGW